MYSTCGPGFFALRMVSYSGILGWSVGTLIGHSCEGSIEAVSFCGSIGATIGAFTGTAVLDSMPEIKH